MRNRFTLALILACFTALFLYCYAPALFRGRQFGFRDAAAYYYPLNQRVQDEWNQGRWPLWEPEENAGMPLLWNPTAAVLYPGKLVFALLPYAWGARVYIVAHTALAFLGMLVLMRSWGTTWFGSALSALAYAFGAPVLFQYCNIIYLIGAAWLPLGVHAVDRWVRLGRRRALPELAVVLSMQALGGEPQAAYLLGLASIGYALGLAWARARFGAPDGAKLPPPRVGRSVVLLAIALAVWCVVTLVLAQWFPKLRAPGKPTRPLFWAAWVPLIGPAVWMVVGLVFFVRCWRRGWRSPLGLTCLGLAASAALSFALTAAQLLPVIEFIQRTSRAAAGGTHDIYAFSLEPHRLVEVIWPNILGTQVEGNKYWGEMIRIPGARTKAWVPSLYVGGLTIVLALSALTLQHAPPWRVWVTVIVVVSLLGSLGGYTSPIWLARLPAMSSKLAMLSRLLPDLGPVDPADTTPIRLDGFLRDGDGGFYWCLANLFPGFRQFRFPAKLFTLTTLGLAVLAGVGRDRVCTAKGRSALTVFLLFLALTLAALAGVILQREQILAAFSAPKGQSMMGPLDAYGGYRAIIQSLVQAAIVFGLGLLLTAVARSRPRLAGSAALIVMTGDLAAANARYVLTVPQAVFENKPEVLKIIHDAERADPSPGPYRIHCMPPWYPVGWNSAASNDRGDEIVMWEHDTLQPKYAIGLGVEYTHTFGAAELHDYDWYFSGFPLKINDQRVARSLGVNLEQAVIYFPRRAYDMWNTRYLILPYWHGGWRDESRSYASFIFETRRIHPDADRFASPDGGMEAEEKWLETRDFKVLRNLQEFPRAWVVHDARVAAPIAGLSPVSRRAEMQEILYAPDPIWRDDTLHAYDPRGVAWMRGDDLQEIRGRLSGMATHPSETVTVTYPNPQQAVLEVTLESDGLVVLADVFYPGWTLKIDGKPAPIYQVNGVMRGALVPADHHRLVFMYEPQSFRLGLQVSIAALAAVLILGAACTRWPGDPASGRGDRLLSTERGIAT